MGEKEKGSETDVEREKRRKRGFLYLSIYLSHIFLSHFLSSAKIWKNRKKKKKKKTVVDI
jgi:uncharacterized Tic20 family protein